ncbi:glutaredoxin 3 [Pyxidicoccus fallax]|uniref:Glutaredoxin n=1 Tax=Pyxidicoccus fallax TaxID=394095 RepID=A0A848LC06_9BACT|nr:glutaredoxin 3 [Pyxidicoccus fallax]NMO16590.1 glutaredoxin 3 [Pyxidicoccus fallax]NPC78371.1 glutaredoxin 3 [Pyxidicoccus fallax]
MAQVTMYTKTYCPYSKRARELMRSKGVAFEDIDVTEDEGRFAEMVERSGGETVPQVFIGGRLVGGADDLNALDARGELDVLLGREDGASPSPA